MTIFTVFAVGLVLLTLLVSFNVAMVNQLAVVGTEVDFQCNSSFPPPWAKIGPKLGDYKSLAFVGKKHPNFKDSRFSFTNQGSLYKMKIQEISIADSGNFRCDGDQPTSYLLSVVR